MIDTSIFSTFSCLYEIEFDQLKGYSKQIEQHFQITNQMIKEQLQSVSPEDTLKYDSLMGINLENTFIIYPNIHRKSLFIASFSLIF
ncbi:hypothetical protein [Tuberibacillus calidus]|uniref:hypothetical protein n=1 Tax=Tuberibacillus calidus TaxID=340097 RepID=UPI000422D205|nr:hypothetical protein [Tuberibacillus calidus]